MSSSSLSVSADQSPGPVTGDDVAQAVDVAVAALRPAVDADWDVPAGSLEWTCWETGEHLADDLFWYAAHIGTLREKTEGDLPFGYASRRPQGPANTVTADRDAGPLALFEVMEACGGILAAVVRATPPTARGHHVYGVSDPEGFAAMGIVETLLHAHDIALGVGVDFEAPADLCARVLHRLFPDAPDDAAPWPALLWVSGRGDLPGRERVGKWRWYGAPRAT
ncbi:maleylpyruvate isomerase N-terminal domain-containing protein [Streptomyces sp. NPDC050095]|uniref:maleylpyruvate isomerase N-terminal domain-containing protein n=1 Tax=unclassified Streptomyces TaxID=2593676 RepID=UPI003421EEE0